MKAVFFSALVIASQWIQNILRNDLQKHLIVSEVYLWDQIRAMPFLGFVQLDLEANVFNKIIKILKIEFYCHANPLRADYGVQHSMITFRIIKQINGGSN